MPVTDTKTELTQVSFKTEPAQLSKVADLAGKHRRHLSGEIRRALDAWIERCEKEEGETA